MITKTKIATAPTMVETWPAWMASAPSSAPTVRCSWTFRGAGKAPERSSSARLVASSRVKLPVI